MSEPVIELYCSEDYEQLPALRKELRKALLQMDLPAYWSEYYVGWSNVPSHVKNVAHPSILLNYAVAWKGSNTPSADELLRIFKTPPKARRSIKWKKILKTNASFLMAVLIAFFPKCPFCWAAYMSMFSFLGLNTIKYQPWLLPVFIVLFFANIVSLYLTRKRHGYKLLLLSLAGATLIVLNRLYWNVPVVVYCGAALLIVASLWNSLSGRMVNSIRLYFS
jgi:mercuric ion transport protein